MKNSWINKKNILVILAGIIILVAIGKLYEITRSTQKNSLTASIVEPEKISSKYSDGKTSIDRDAWKTFGLATGPGLLPYGTKLIPPGDVEILPLQ